MRKEELAKQIIAEVNISLGDLLKHCVYCKWSACLGEHFVCPDKQKWLRELKSEIEKILEK